MNRAPTDLPATLAHEQRWLEAYARRKDPAAFEALVELHRNHVYDLARRILGDASLAEDVAQETFLIFYRKAGTLSHDTSVRAWLLQVARRNALKRQRSNSRRKKREELYAMERPTVTDGMARPAGSVEAAELRQAFETLPPDMQIPLALHYMHGLPHSQIAGVLSLPDGTVASRIGRGLERLRALLGAKTGTAAALAIGLLPLENGLKALPLAPAPAHVGALNVMQSMASAKSAGGKAARSGRASGKGSKGGKVGRASKAGKAGLVWPTAAAVACGVLLVAGLAWWGLHPPAPVVAPAAVVPPVPAVGTPASAPKVVAVEPPEAPAWAAATLVGHWRLDEGSGSSVADRSAGHQTGTLSAGAVWVGKRLTFDGEEGCVTLPNSPALDHLEEGDFTLSAWFKPTDVPLETYGKKHFAYGLILKPGYHVGLSYLNSAVFELDAFNEPDTHLFATSTAKVAGVFYHVCGVVDRTHGETKMYVNGTLENRRQFDSAGKPKLYPAQSWKIGAAATDLNSANAWTAKGTIRDVYLIKGVLTDAEVAALAKDSVPSGTATKEETIR